MIKHNLIILAIIATTTCSGSANKDSVMQAMEKHQVVPDVIDTAPDKAAEVNYSDIHVNNGNELTPTSVKDIPMITWEAENAAFYTLIMTDPDAPSREEPTRREFLHWQINNIPGNDITKGYTRVEYIGSGPPKGTGLHRYVFLVYKQPNGKIDFDEEFISKNTATGRPMFNTKSYAIKYQLGTPVAGNFYQAEYDDYVPILHKQLGF